MMEPPPKLRRVSALRAQLPYVSQTAFAAFCAVAQDESLPRCSRNDVRAARDAVAYQDTPYGKVVTVYTVQDTDGNDVEFEMTNPFAFLWVAAQKPRFAALVRRTLQRSPPSPSAPWRQVLYVDEVTPGNDRKTDNRKKLQCMYFTCLEFGGDGISKEDFWITAATIRSKRVANFSAAVSAVVRKYLNVCYSTSSFNFHVSGVRLVVEGCEFRLFAMFAGFLGDEAALHAIWLCKGASGVKPCVMCLNMVNSNWVGVDSLENNSFCKPYNTVFTIGECVLQTKHTIWAIVDKLKRERPLVSASEFKEKTKALGFNYSPEGILMDHRLRAIVDPCLHTIFDWPHSILEGVLPKQMTKLHTDFRELGVDVYPMLDDYVRKFTVPHRFSGCSWVEVFNPSRRRSMKDAGLFKATMSEGLCVVPIVAHWLVAVAADIGVAPLACDAFVKLALLISILQAAGRGDASASPGDVRAAVESHLKAYAAAHGDDMIPKFHHSLHYAQQYEDLKVMPTTLPLERKHKTAKAFAEAIDNTSRDWDSHVLKECLNKALAAYDVGDYLRLDAGLYNAKTPPKHIKSWLADIFGGDVDVEYAVSARYSSHGSCARNDVIAIDGGAEWQAAQIEFFVSVSGASFAVVVPLSFVSRHTGYSRWNMENRLAAFVPLTSVVEALIYCKDNSCFTLLHPWSLQRP